MPVTFSLTTARLRLERLGPQHLDDLVELDSDPLVVRFVGGVSLDRAAQEAQVLPRLRAWDEQPYGFAAAYEDGAFVGWFHLRPSVADPEVLELGYRLRRAAWGRGLATEGSRGILRYAFETLGQPAVDACADPANVASTRVMVKCGMRRLGTIVHPRFDKLVDRYLVTRDEAILEEPAGSGA